MSVFGLVYVSRAVTVFSAEQIQTLMQVAQQRNSRLNITGMLLMSDGYFFQLLEGEESAVRSVFKAITTDKRHEEIRLLFADTLTKRYCPAWSMMLLVNSQISPAQTQDKINHLLALSQQSYLHKDQLISDLFCRFMTVRQLQEFKDNQQCA